MSPPGDETSLYRSLFAAYPDGLLLVDLSNHAGLLQEYGSEAAERSLVLAASRLRSVLRDVDTAARVGAHQYALLIEAPCSPRATAWVATSSAACGRPRCCRPRPT